MTQPIVICRWRVYSTTKPLIKFQLVEPYIYEPTTKLNADIHYTGAIEGIGEQL